MSDLFSLEDIGLDSEDITTVSTENDAFCRLIYLTEAMKIELPNWLKYKLPFSESLGKPVALWSELYKAAYRKGSVYGEGNLEEFKQCLDHVVQPELKNYVDRKKFWNYLDSLANGLFEHNEEVWLEEIEGGEQIEKFNTGYTPFDNAVKGFYESIVTVAGLPGSGKTSHLLTWMGYLARYYPVWYFQTEIPSKLIKARISLVKPEIVVPGCKVFCGNYTSESILERVKKEPDPNRIIIYDSPEVKTSTLEPVAYFEKVYQDLVSIKMQSKMVVVTSQIKQNIGWDDLGIYSLSDSAAKARYSDIILYVGRFIDTVLVKTGKNRFGSLNQTLAHYDYETLSLKEDALDSMFE